MDPLGVTQYLQPKDFSQLQSKVESLIKKKNWKSKWSAEEIKIIHQFTGISTVDRKFQELMKKRLRKFKVVKVQNVISKLMNREKLQFATVFTECDYFECDSAPSKSPPPIPPPPLPPRPRTLPILSPPSIPERENKEEISISEKEEEETVALIEDLQNIESFEEIAKKAKEARAANIFTAVEIKFVSQILACQSLIDQNTPFLQAIQSCLSSQTLKKVVSDYILSENIEEEKDREKILQNVIQKLRTYEPSKSMSKIEKFNVCEIPQSRRRRAVDLEIRTKPTRSKSMSAIRSVLRLSNSRRRRVQSLLTSKSLLKFPNELVDPVLRKKLIETTVCLRFLFCDNYHRLFSKSVEKEVLNRLMQIFLMEKYTSFRKEDILHKTFDNLLENHSKTVKKVIKKLAGDLKNHNKNNKNFMPLSGTSLPKIFLAPPFDLDGGMDKVIRLIGTLRFMCTFSYDMYPEKEKELVNLLLNASLIRDVLLLPFSKSLQIAMKEVNEFDENAMISLIERMHLKQISNNTVKEEMHKTEDLTLLLQDSFLVNERFFDLLIEHIKEIHSMELEADTRAIIALFLSVDARKKSEPLLLEKLIQNSFTLNGLKTRFGMDDEGLIVQKFSKIYQQLVPKPVVHASLMSQEKFDSLIDRAKNYSGTDKNVLKIATRLESAGVLYNQGVGYRDSAAYYLNYLDLREVFNSNDDFENHRKFAHCINLILDHGKDEIKIEE